MHLLRRSVVFLLLVGCGGGGSEDLDAGPGDDVDAGGDPSEELFRPDHVVEVAVTMDAADWAVMRDEPEVLGLPDTTCDAVATVEPYTTFHADVTVDGVTATDVGIRKKGGFGSISSTRPGIKIDAHEFVTGQRIWGLKHLTLNNNQQDETLVSQCLGYQLFAAAGVPASRCNFAHVVVNGEDLGIYSNVETIKPQFLSRHFADNNGNLYESGGDFVPGGTGGFQPKNEPIDCSDLDPVVDALAAPDAELADRLDAVVDLDEFMRYWAMEVITDHWDGYANNRNNYYFYHDPTSGQISFIPWGIDSLFTGRERTTRPDSVFACGSMPWRLYDAPETRAMYLATLRELLAGPWDENAILTEINRMQDLLEPFEGSMAARLAPVRDFVSGREAALLAELDAGDPVWPYPAGDQSCRIVIGSFSATFDTTWDTLGQFGIGTGTISGTISGTDLASPTVYASAGLDQEGKAAMQILSPLPDGRYTVIFVIVHDPANFVPSSRAIDLATVASILTFYDPATDTASGGGLVLPGTFTLDAASTTPDAPVTGSISGEVMEL